MTIRRITDISVVDLSQDMEIEVSRPLVKSSPKMAEPYVSKFPTTSKYPWRELGIGQSFAVGKQESKIATLRSHAWKMGKKLGKKFRVIDHGEDGYEVGCIGVDAGNETSEDNAKERLWK